MVSRPSWAFCPLMPQIRPIVKGMKAALLLLALPLVGCGSMDLVSMHVGVHGQTIKGTGKPISQTRKAEAVTAVEASGALEVVIVKGSVPKLEVQAQKEILPHIKSTFKNGRLTIFTEGSMSTDGSMMVRITMPNVREIEANGATTVTTAGLNGGAGKFTLTGASKLTASGTFKSINVTVTGASEANLKSVSAGDAKVDASGASKAWIKASGHLLASASGASEVRYSGKPTSVTKNASGASSISQS
jgi:hypothetical protein